MGFLLLTPTRPVARGVPYLNPLRLVDRYIVRKMNSKSLSIRLNNQNPNHHLWNNHGTWWLHYTMHLPDHTKKRVRQNLHTHDINKARLLRDKLLEDNQI